MNEQILQIFEENPDHFISGEELSRRLSCSRTAVWKHIQDLRKQGYEFEAVSRLGYRLVRKPDKIDLKKLSALLNTKTLGRDVHYFESVLSTQMSAHDMVASGAKEGTLIIAEQQTAGRGRMGRKWHSPLGKGIWMSLILAPRIPIHFAPQLTLLIAVALCRAIKQKYPMDVGIKWPNDLLVGGRKISGILLESSAEDERLRHVIAGIGISANLLQEDYPPELWDKATSLSIESGQVIDRELLIAAFLNELEALYDLYHEQGFAPLRILWEALNVTLHRPVKVHTHDGVVEGLAESIDDLGGLNVRLPDGRVVILYSGENDTPYKA